MNVQKHKKMRREVYQEIKFLSKKNIHWLLGLLGIGGLILVTLFMTRQTAAQSSTVTLSGNETLELFCDGRGFRVERLARDHLNITCRPFPGNVEPTQPPQPTPTTLVPTIAPTQTAVPTQVLPSPTSPPPEPTATVAPPEPTLPPPEPTLPPPEPTATVAPPEPTIPPPEPTVIPPNSGNTFFISQLGNNTDGRSWQTAWSELNQVDWSLIQPGDTVLIDGGANGMTYTTMMAPTASGTAAEPITIRVADEPGRNGQAIIFGGRSTPLPYCDQTNYQYQTEGVLDFGIYLENVSWLIIDGGKWSGIALHGTNRYGIYLQETTSRITLRNMEIYDNGYATDNGGNWSSGGKGINLRGNQHLFERLLIHDNGQDAIQSNGANVRDITIRESWFYNARQHPTVNQSYNWCTHTDALQIHNGGIVEDITIEDTVLGPGFTNTLLLGDTAVDVNNVTLRDVLVLKGNDNNVSAHSSATPSVHSWTLQNVTIYGSDLTFNLLTYKGSDITITDSLLVGGRIYIPNTVPVLNGNCQWQTTGEDIGTEIDPLFTNAVPDAFSGGDYTLRSDSPCLGKGARITSPEQLLNMPDSN